MTHLPFCATCCGVLHEVCEDASGLLEGLPGTSFAAAVADGHGDPTCTRSGRGAQLAVKVALAGLSRLATFVEQHRETSRKDVESVILPKLKQLIATTWLDAVEADLAKTPVTEDEAAGLVTKSLDCSAIHLYGTTLVAGLFFPDLCILIQQGDGCCVLVDEHGVCHRPMPDDPRCVGNLTSSLTDPDAGLRMRHAIVDLGQPLTGCFLASDGVDKSLSDGDGATAFFTWLVLCGQEATRDAYETWLADALAHLTAQGSGDDVSLAGFVVQGLSPECRSILQVVVEQAALRQQVEEVRDKLVSMQRKHQYLSKRWAEGAPEGTEYPAYHETFLAYEKQLVQLEAKLRQASAGEV